MVEYRIRLTAFSNPDEEPHESAVYNDAGRDLVVFFFGLTPGEKYLIHSMAIVGDIESKYLYVGEFVIRE